MTYDDDVLHLATDPGELLNLFYRQTYWRHLRIISPSVEDDRLPRSCLTAFIHKTYGNAVADRVRQRLRDYMASTAPACKSNALFTYLKAHHAGRFQRILDFGCGTGALAYYVATHLEMIPELICYVDADRDALAHVPNLQGTRIIRAPALHELKIPIGPFDLIILSHTLHHLSELEQEETVARCVSMLSPQGITYVFEDSWADSPTLDYHPKRFIDASFSHMNTACKRKVFEINDYRANAWCYDRHFDLTRCHYRPLDQWKRLVRLVGGSVLASGHQEFDANRLHGVPSVWIIIGRRE